VRLRETLLDLVVTGLFRFIAILPLFVLQAIGAGFGRLLWLLNTQSRYVTEVNLKLCFPDLSPQQRQILAKRSLIESSKTLLEVIAIWLSPLEKNKTLIKRVSGQDCLDQALQKKQGVILLAPHLGNWELVGMFGAQIGPFTAMYAPAKMHTMRKIMYAGREQFGCKLAPTNTQGVRILLKALKLSESIGILPDQVPEPEGGLYAPFFGEPALTMTLIATLAARTGATVICGYAKRLQGESGFEICLRPAVANIASENLQEAVVALNQSVEACVRDCPEQYQWEYKRFKRRPAGLPRLY
jgi:KDO2-lipid IV(A) lauroyltransferase